MHSSTEWKTDRLPAIYYFAINLFPFICIVLDANWQDFTSQVHHFYLFYFHCSEISFVKGCSIDIPLIETNCLLIHDVTDVNNPVTSLHLVIKISLPYINKCIICPFFLYYRVVHRRISLYMQWFKFQCSFILNLILKLF